MAFDDMQGKEKVLNGWGIDLSGGGNVWAAEDSEGNIYVKLSSKLLEEELSSGKVLPRSTTEVVDGFSITVVKLSREGAGALFQILKNL